MADNNKATSLDNVRQYVKGVLRGWIRNKSTLDKFSEDTDGNLLFAGDEVGGGNDYTLPVAGETVLGGVKIGSGLSITSDGVLSSSDGYVLPKASSTTLGGIIVGDNLSIDGNGVLSAVVSGGTGTGCEDVSESDLAEMLARVFSEPVDIPVPNATLVYNGNSQTMTFDNYDSDKMTVSNNSKTNAGTYNATFALKNGYLWKDNTTAPKKITWEIEKAEGYALWSRNNMFVGENPSTTLTTSVTSRTFSTFFMSNEGTPVTHTQVTDAGFTYTYSTTEGITVEISNPTKNGTWELAFHVGASTNVDEYTTTITVTVEL